jgi:hypothetical protein
MRDNLNPFLKSETSNNPFDPLPVSETYRKRANHQSIYWKARAQTIEGRALRLLNSAKVRSKKDLLAYDLTPEWLIEKLTSGHCEVSGIKFDLLLSQTTSKNKYAPSLDRIDPSKGYTKANTRCVVWMYNSCKSEYSDGEVLEFARALLKTDLLRRTDRMHELYHELYHESQQ